MSTDDDKSLVRYVHTGHVLTSVGQLRITLQVNTREFRELQQRLRLKLRKAGAVPIAGPPELFGEIIEQGL